MKTHEIQGEDYTIQYDPESATICFLGEMSLRNPTDYAPIIELLDEITNENPPILIMDLTKLSFLNSSGISILSKFVIRMRSKPGIQLMILGSHSVTWQSKSLKNLQRLLPSLQIEVQ